MFEELNRIDWLSESVKIFVIMLIPYEMTTGDYGNTLWSYLLFVFNISPSPTLISIQILLYIVVAFAISLPGILFKHTITKNPDSPPNMTLAFITYLSIIASSLLISMMLPMDVSSPLFLSPHLTRYSTLILLFFVLIPSLQQYIQITDIGSLSILSKKQMMFSLIFLTFVVPFGYAFLRSGRTDISIVLSSFWSIYSNQVVTTSHLQCRVLYDFEISLIFVALFLRFVFLDRLLKFLSGSYSRAKVILLGILNEVWVLVFLYEVFIIYPTYINYGIIVPLPLLTVFGIFIVMLKDTTEEYPITTDDVDDQVLAVEEFYPEVIRIPLTYRLVSKARRLVQRIQDRRLKS